MANAEAQEIPVALYDRLSTRAQAEEGYASEGHLRELRAEMAAQGRRIVAEVTDNDQKRWMYDRPGVRRLMELAQAGQVDEVWSWHWQRYGEGSVPSRLEEDLGDFGVRLRALGDGGEGLGGRIYRAIGGVLSAEDQAERVRKSGMGKRSKAREGKVLGSGQKARFGFAHVRDGRGKVVGYEVVPGEMAVVRRILEELASGASIRSVQSGLEKDGIAAPKGGARWTRDTLKKIAREDTYRPYRPEELRALVAEGLMSEEVHASLRPGKPYGVDFYGRTKSRRLSRATKRRVVEDVPRSEWVAVPVCLEGSGLERATVDAARRNVEANRASSKAGKRKWELSRGFLFCADCGRSMGAVVTRNAKYGTAYHYYACPEPRDARPAAPSRCRNRHSHPAEDLEYQATRLFEDNASHERLAELFEQAVREEEERLGIKTPAGAAERHEKLSAEMEALNAERKEYLRLAARGNISDAELDDMLSEIDGKRQHISSELRATEQALATRGTRPSYSPVHAEWYEDPEAIHPGEVLTHASSPEQVRTAYRRYGVRFEVDAEGTLTMRMELPLSDPPSYESDDYTPM
jgi:hypothetical protein